jgi:hypothetical protein
VKEVGYKANLRIIVEEDLEFNIEDIIVFLVVLLFVTAIDLDQISKVPICRG